MVATSLRPRSAPSLTGMLSCDPLDIRWLWSLRPTVTTDTSADFCVAVRSPYDDLRHCRSHELRPTAFTARPPDLTTALPNAFLGSLGLASVATLRHA